VVPRSKERLLTLPTLCQLEETCEGLWLIEFEVSVMKKKKFLTLTTGPTAKPVSHSNNQSEQRAQISSWLSPGVNSI